MNPLKIFGRKQIHSKALLATPILAASLLGGALVVAPSAAAAIVTSTTTKYCSTDPYGINYYAKVTYYANTANHQVSIQRVDFSQPRYNGIYAGYFKGISGTVHDQGNVIYAYSESPSTWGGSATGGWVGFSQFWVNSSSTYPIRVEARAAIWSSSSPQAYKYNDNCNLSVWA